MENFWKDTWEMRKKIFGYPTVQDLSDAYKLGTLPVKVCYVCSHSTNTSQPNIWVPYTELEPMKKLNEEFEKMIGQAMWGIQKDFLHGK
jgi:hypothetical protein